MLQSQIDALTTELAMSNILDDRARIKTKIELVTNPGPWPKNKRYTISVPSTLTQTHELPKVSPYSTQLSYYSPSKINPFKMMQFQNNNGGIKVQQTQQNYFQNKIKPIKSPKKQKPEKISASKSERLEIPHRRSLPPREKTSILDRNNLYLVSFLKNKVKRISKLIEKPENHFEFRDVHHFPSDIEAAAIEYNSKSLSRRSSSVISGGKRFSRVRSSKGNGLEVAHW